MKSWAATSSKTPAPCGSACTARPRHHHERPRYALELADGQDEAVLLDRRACDDEEDDPANRGGHGRDGLADEVGQLAEEITRLYALIDPHVTVEDPGDG